MAKRTRHWRRLTWLTEAWRPVAAYVYLTICVVDFIIMPIYFEWSNAQLHSDKIVDLALKFDGAAQVQALNLLRAERSWMPLTLQQSGLLHIAFGAILGAAAWTHGQERIRRIDADINDADIAATGRSMGSHQGGNVNVNVQPPT
jgi:hypothetical protein